MTQRDQLQEQYEHALFALMMDEAIQKQGQQALDDNKQLKKSNDFTISPKTDKKIKRLISRKLRFHPVGMKGMSIPKILKRAAFASCAVVFLTGTAFAVSPTLREQMLNLLVTVTDISTDFQFSYNGKSEIPGDYTVSEAEDFTVGWIPDEFIFEKKEITSTSIDYRFYTVKDHWIDIYRETSDTLNFGIDIEDAKVNYISIHGKSALVSEKEDIIIVTWAEEETATIFCVSGEGVEKKDVIKVAMNIQE